MGVISREIIGPATSLRVARFLKQIRVTCGNLINVGFMQCDWCCTTTDPYALTFTLNPLNLKMSNPCFLAVNIQCKYFRCNRFRPITARSISEVLRVLLE